jgi:hypothetical protein
MWATYEEWKQLGRHVRKGVSSMLRDPQGTPLFKFSQTDKTPKYEVVFEYE